MDLWYSIEINFKWRVQNINRQNEIDNDTFLIAATLTGTNEFIPENLWCYTLQRCHVSLMSNQINENTTIYSGACSDQQQITRRSCVLLAFYIMWITIPYLNVIIYDTYKADSLRVSSPRSFCKQVVEYVLFWRANNDHCPSWRFSANP